MTHAYTQHGLRITLQGCQQLRTNLLDDKASLRRLDGRSGVSLLASELPASVSLCSRDAMKLRLRLRSSREVSIVRLQRVWIRLPARLRRLKPVNTVRPRGTSIRLLWRSRTSKVLSACDHKLAVSGRCCAAACVHMSRVTISSDTAGGSKQASDVRCLPKAARLCGTTMRLLCKSDASEVLSAC